MATATPQGSIAHLQGVDLGDGPGLPLLVLAQQGLGVLDQYNHLIIISAAIMIMTIVIIASFLMIISLITSALPCLATASSFSFQRSVRKARREESLAWIHQDDYRMIDQYNDHEDDQDRKVMLFFVLRMIRMMMMITIVTFCVANSFLDDSR